MATVLRFVSPTLDVVGTQSVYWKARWQDAWVLVPELWASETVWTCCPSIGTAQLRLRYGDELHRLLTQWRNTFRSRNRLRHYVRIDHVVGPINADDQSDLTRRWYGVLDLELDELEGTYAEEQGGETITYARGKNHFLAFGLESLLDETKLGQSIVATTGGTVEVARGLTFNPRRDKLTLNPHGPSAASVIGNRSPAAGDGGVFVFHSSKTGGKPWSTQDIAGYLLKHAAPRDHGGLAVLEWELADPNELVPNWDQPELAQQGRTVWELLASLFARQRMYSFRVVPESEEPGVPIQLIPFTFNAEDLHLDAIVAGATIPANPQQIILALEQDRGAAPAVKRSTADAFDQVIVTGAPATSTATFSFIDETLVAGWSAALEIDYENGASGAANYPAASEIEARIEANIAARALDKFKAVFARFVLPDPFFGFVGTGTSGDRGEALMPAADLVNTPDPLAPEDHRFLTELALLAGYDYSAAAVEDQTATETGPAPHKPLAPLVLFPRPGQTGSAGDKVYRQAEKLGLLAELEVAGLEGGQIWTASVRVEHDDGALWINVSTLSQDTIAGSDFGRLADIDPEPLADYREMLCTLSVPWSRYCEARYPPDDELPFGFDTVRVLRLDAGDGYRLDYVVPGTVVAIDAGGLLVRSTSGGYVRDARDQLGAIAQLAWQWYGQTRRALALSTSLVNNALEVGMLVVSVGDPDIEGDIHVDDVGSVVTSIRLATPLAEGPLVVGAPIPRMFYDTAFGEFDVLKIR